METAIKILSDLQDYYKSQTLTGAIQTAIDALKHMTKIRAVVAEWKTDTWTDNASYECMVKIAEIVEERSREE